MQRHDTHTQEQRGDLVACSCGVEFTQTQQSEENNVHGDPIRLESAGDTGIDLDR